MGSTLLGNLYMNSPGPLLLRQSRRYPRKNIWKAHNLVGLYTKIYNGNNICCSWGMMQKHDFADMMRCQRQTQWIFFKGRGECILWWRPISQSCSRYTDNGCDNGPLALPFVLFWKLNQSISLLLIYWSLWVDLIIRNVQSSSMFKQTNFFFWDIDYSSLEVDISKLFSCFNSKYKRHGNVFLIQRVSKFCFLSALVTAHTIVQPHIFWCCQKCKLV